MLAGQSGVAGSAQIGDHVMIGGQVGINGHCRQKRCILRCSRRRHSRWFSCVTGSGLAPADG
jgi:phage terminase large subunit-like protein